jgi:hypothetical protein
MTKPAANAIRTTSTAIATAAIALILTANPAQASRPYPGTEASTTGTGTSATAAAESGLQAGQIAAGTGAGLLVGAGISTLILRGRRRPVHRPVAA